MVVDCVKSCHVRYKSPLADTYLLSAVLRLCTPWARCKSPLLGVWQWRLVIFAPHMFLSCPRLKIRLLGLLVAAAGPAQAPLLSAAGGGLSWSQWSLSRPPGRWPLGLSWGCGGRDQGRSANNLPLTTSWLLTAESGNYHRVEGGVLRTYSLCHYGNKCTPPLTTQCVYLHLLNWGSGASVPSSGRGN